MTPLSGSCRAKIPARSIFIPDAAAKKPPTSICRENGYVIIARNYRSPRSRSELDLVGWDGAHVVLYRSEDPHHAQHHARGSGVDAEKQRDLSHVAREFLRKIKDDRHSALTL